MPSIKSAHFKIGDLFYGQSGNRLTKEDMIPGETNYIGAISSNNGVREHIHADDVDVFPGNCITVNYNGSVGEAFYQDEPFGPQTTSTFCMRARIGYWTEKLGYLSSRLSKPIASSSIMGANGF